MKNIRKLKDEFFAYLRYEKNAAENTITGYAYDLNEFCGFLEKHGISVKDIDHRKLREFVAFLAARKYQKSSISRKLSGLRSFFKYLSKHELIGDNPARYLSSFKGDEKIPSFLEYDEVRSLLEVPDKNTLRGLRDAAIMEFLYTSGIRVSELVSLNAGDVNFLSGMVKVKGKGAKQRWVPVGEKALECLERYFLERRKTQGEKPELFLNNSATRLTKRSVGRIIDKYIKILSIKKHVTPHTFRHTFATHLLNAGCDLRSIQEMLGHVNLSTTQVYTHLTTQKLKKVYDGTHPHAAIQR